MGRMTKIHGRGYLFGNPVAHIRPNLPKKWRWVIDDKWWLMAISPTGGLYLVRHIGDPSEDKFTLIPSVKYRNGRFEKL